MATLHVRGAGERAAPLLRGTCVVALGDSIAAGIGAPHVSEGCMALLAADLGVPISLLAIPGATSGDMVSPGGQLERAEATIGELTAAGGRPGPVTLSIGGNDAIEARSVGDAVALSTYERNLATILRRLLAALGEDGHRRLGIQTVYRLNDGSAPEVDVRVLTPRHSRQGGFNAAIRRVAGEAGVTVVDVAGAFRGRAAELTWMRSGDIHPRDVGHRLIADTWLAACEPAG